MSSDPDISPKATNTYVHFHLKRMAEIKEQFPALTYEGRNNLVKAEWNRKKARENPYNHSTGFFNYGQTQHHSRFWRRGWSENHAPSYVPNYVPNYVPDWVDNRVSYSEQVSTIQNQTPDGFFEEEIEDTRILIPNTFEIDQPEVKTHSSEVVPKYFSEKIISPHITNLDATEKYFADEDSSSSLEFRNTNCTKILGSEINSNLEDMAGFFATESGPEYDFEEGIW